MSIPPPGPARRRPNDGIYRAQMIALFIMGIGVTMVALAMMVYRG